MNKKFIFFSLFTLILFMIFLNVFSTFTFAAYPKLISTLINGFETIKGWIIKIATPAAAVAVRYRDFYEEIQFW